MRLYVLGCVLLWDVYCCGMCCCGLYIVVGCVVVVLLGLSVGAEKACPQA